MASLKKRGRAYYAQYYDNGKQKRVNLHTESLQVAKEKLRQIESAQFREEEIPLTTKTPIGDILEKYIKYKSGHSRDKNIPKINTYLRGAFGPVCEALQVRNQAIAQKAVKCPSAGSASIISISHIEHLSAEVLSTFLSELIKDKRVSPRTANHYRQTIVTLCNWAQREGGVRFPGGKNPVADVKCYKVPKSMITFLKLKDIRTQLDVLANDTQLQTMVAVFIYAGLRREEALWLTPDDFEWSMGNHGVIMVRGKTIDGKTWMPKTGEDRPVPISKTLREYLDSYREIRKPGTWFFCAPRGKQWDPDNFSELLRESNSKHGLSWSCLDYRHTFGSQLAMKGESLYKVSSLMGNSPEICRKHYAALMPESLMESVEFPTDEMPSPTSAVSQSSAEPPRRGFLKLVVNNS
ncbi:site-specific integrase [Geomonas nitrogeniifigens]|uniref:tyrosine-type recombinase/integrase n=1 Tax=Geomonas diazotrophica TaxID=2843197 RepID=UPI001C2C9D78|nr:site-specific integrase [Geomonas nitrogeniifigens]QXE85518.1 site-specific integrase [Geomonas nitrogeniifigens]